MSFSNFSKTVMLSALLEATKRLSDGKHKVVPAHNGVILNPATYLGANPLYIQLHIYGHNPPVITNSEPIQWTANSINWPTITEVFIVNDSTGQEILMTGALSSPYAMPIGNTFIASANSWEASLV